MKYNKGRGFVVESFMEVCCLCQRAAARENKKKLLASVVTAALKLGAVLTRIVQCFHKNIGIITHLKCGKIANNLDIRASKIHISESSTKSSYSVATCISHRKCCSLRGKATVCGCCCPSASAQTFSRSPRQIPNK